MQERLERSLSRCRTASAVSSTAAAECLYQSIVSAHRHKTPGDGRQQNVFEKAADGNRCAVLRSGIARIGSIRHRRMARQSSPMSAIFVDVRDCRCRVGRRDIRESDVDGAPPRSRQGRDLERRSINVWISVMSLMTDTTPAISPSTKIGLTLATIVAILLVADAADARDARAQHGGSGCHRQPSRRRSVRRPSPASCGRCKDTMD